MKCGSRFLKFFFFDSNESPLKWMKNAFYFMLKATFVLEIFTFLCYLCFYIEKYFSTMVNFKIYGITDQTTNN